MAVTVSGINLLDSFAQRYGQVQLLENAEISSIAAGALVSVAHMRRGTWATNHFSSKGTTIWRPGNATGVADDYRDAGDLTVATGSLAPDANWADTTIGTEDIYFVFNYIHPLWIIDAFNLALRQIYFQNDDWLSMAADPGFQSSGTGSYTASSTTFTKITTADSFNVFPPFIAAGRSANSGPNGYLEQQFRVDRGGEYYTGVLFRADVGTFELGWYDVTNSAELGTQVTSTEENWMFAWRRESVTSGSAGTETLGVRLRGDGATDDIYYNGLIVYPTQAKRLTISTTWDTGFSTPSLSYVTFSKNIAANVEAAWSMVRHEIPRSDYAFIRTRPGANPNAIEFREGTNWLQYPILINGRRAHSDVDGPFTRVMTETTSADRDLVIAHAAANLFSNPKVETPEKDSLLAKARDDVKQLSPQFVTEKPPRRYWSYPALSN